ncbi:hypothetical protein M3Y97_00769100 [Aphelenchoides bicaudatus]|nr:hypothetical protein M3Y97_00769100 [Aphelenchoides bicaudatus]
MKFLLIALVGVFFVSLSLACDLNVHVKSDTAKKFKAQVTAPNGHKSDKWSFTQQRQKETFGQKANECQLGAWKIETFDESGSAAKSVQVTLNGIGRVQYNVGDDLVPKQVERQGAICTGQCADLAAKFLLLTLALITVVYACDVDVHIQSNTARQFSVQIVAPNGQLSERWTFNRNRQRQNFGQTAGICVPGDWVLNTYDHDGGALVKTVRISLDGTGRIVYGVNDDLDFDLIENNGLICNNGMCSTSVSGSRSFSRTGSRTRID